jgi:uncharacterized protein YrrD
MDRSIQFKEGVDVFTSDGRQMGKVNRLVVEPATNEVTHIVVQKGWLFPEDKVVPVQMVSSGTEEKIVLTKQLSDFDELPPFEETHYFRAMEDDFTPTGGRAYMSSPSYYWYPPQGYISYPGYDLEYYTIRNIPDNAIPLREGTDVISSDGEHVGNIECLFIESASNRITHFLIVKGLFFKDRKLIPVHWVKSVEEDKVHLLMSSRLLERLPAYEPHDISR